MHLILFDIDGTLIRGFGMGRLALERAFEEVYGVEAVGHPAAREVHYAGSTDPRIIADLAAALGIDDGTFLRRRDELERAYLRHLEITVAECDTHAPCPGMEELLERLHGHPRIALGLLTGNIEAGGRIKIDRFGFNRYFPFGGFGGDGADRVEMAQRARARAEARLERRLDPEHVLVVGDTTYDVASGRAHGFLTVGVGTGFVDLPTLREAGPSAVFENLTPRHGFESWLRERWDLSEEAEPV